MANELHTHKQCQTCQKTFPTNELLQYHLDLYRIEEQDLLARLAACRAHTTTSTDEDATENECDDQGTKRKKVKLCPYCSKEIRKKEIRRHYRTHVKIAESCLFCDKFYDQLSAFMRHNKECESREQADETVKNHADVKVKYHEKKANSEYSQFYKQHQAGTAKAQPEKRPLEAEADNPRSDTLQSSKKARVDPDGAFEGFIVNSEQDAVSTGLDMRQPSGKVQEPAQRALVDPDLSSESGNPFFPNPEQEGTLVTSWIPHRLNVEDTGGPISEPIPLEATNQWDEFAPEYCKERTVPSEAPWFHTYTPAQNDPAQNNPAQNYPAQNYPAQNYPAQNYTSNQSSLSLVGPYNGFGDYSLNPMASAQCHEMKQSDIACLPQLSQDEHAVPAAVHL